MSDVRRIAMWSGPRNLSTAMMRSFGNRADTFVSDEPFYGAFLRSSGAAHPMREEVIAAMECDWARVAAAIAGPPPEAKPVWYQKHMWHHMVGPIGYADFAGFTHAFLIRAPERMIASYLRKREAAVFEDFGLDRQAEFFDREADRLGEAPPVVDAGDVLRDPQGTLGGLCERLGVELHVERVSRPRDAPGNLQAWARDVRYAAGARLASSERALLATGHTATDQAETVLYRLAWPPGRRATDGPWAPHWYGAVEASTGFGPPEDDPIDLPDDARRLAERCRPYYEALAAHRVGGSGAGACIGGGRTAHERP